MEWRRAVEVSSEHSYTQKGTHHGTHRRAALVFHTALKRGTWKAEAQVTALSSEQWIEGPPASSIMLQQHRQCSHQHTHHEDCKVSACSECLLVRTRAQALITDVWSILTLWW